MRLYQSLRKSTTSATTTIVVVFAVLSIFTSSLIVSGQEIITTTTTKEDSDSLCPIIQAEPGSSCSGVVPIGTRCNWGNECCLKDVNNNFPIMDCTNTIEQCSYSFSCECARGSEQWMCFNTDFCMMSCGEVVVSSSSSSLGSVVSGEGNNNVMIPPSKPPIATIPEPAVLGGGPGGSGATVDSMPVLLPEPPILSEPKPEFMPEPPILSEPKPEFMPLPPMTESIPLPIDESLMPVIPEPLTTNMREDPANFTIKNDEDCPIDFPEPGSTCSISDASIRCRWGKECCKHSCELTAQEVCYHSYECNCENSIWLCLATDYCNIPPCNMQGNGNGADLFNDVCGTPNDPCMNTENWVQCKLLLDAGCSNILIMESCPLQFDCETTTTTINDNNPLRDNDAIEMITTSSQETEVQGKEEDIVPLSNLDQPKDDVVVVNDQQQQQEEEETLTNNGKTTSETETNGNTEIESNGGGDSSSKVDGTTTTTTTATEEEGEEEPSSSTTTTTNNAIDELNSSSSISPIIVLSSMNCLYYIFMIVSVSSMILFA